jgi:cytochrome b subunit of formate dehydrogenase
MYSILGIYGLAFLIGFFVSVIIWALYKLMDLDTWKKIRHRESYQEMRKMKHNKIKEA